MALVVTALAGEGERTWESVGAIKDGEYAGDPALRAEFESYPLDAEGIEAALVEEYSGHALKVTQVPDEAVDLETHRERWE
jgi:hypothetical protein